MNALYEIHILHEGQAAAFVSLEQALTKQIAEIGISPRNWSVLENQPVPVKATDDDITRLVVFLASDTTCTEKVSQRISEWLKSGTLVLPLVQSTDNFSSVVPQALHALNSLAWDRKAGPSAELVIDILRRCGLAEEERAVFISYKRKDSEGIATQLWQALSARGFGVFLDKHSVDRGVNFQATLFRELRRKSMVLLLESPRIRESDWVLQEVMYALRHKLGLLSAVWKDVAGSETLRIPELPDGYRTLLKDEDFCGKGEKARLKKTRLRTLLEEVEIIHAHALARRRKELLNGFLADLGNAPVEWHGPWQLRVSGKGKQTAHIEVTPRPIVAEDLFECEKRGLTADRSYVLHPGMDVSADDSRYLKWLVAGNKVRAISATAASQLSRRFRK